MKSQCVKDTSFYDEEECARNWHVNFKQTIIQAKEERFVKFYCLLSLFFLKIAGKMSAVAGKQVETEKKRLQESQLIAESEKRLYVKVRRIAGEGGGEFGRERDARLRGQNPPSSGLKRPKIPSLNRNKGFMFSP